MTKVAFPNLGDVVQQPSNTGPHFSLRKLPVRNERDMTVSLPSSYNFDSLRSKFTGAKKTEPLSELINVTQKRGYEQINSHSDGSQDDISAVYNKKSRTSSFHRCLSRAGTSRMHLDKLHQGKSNSLTFQLDCLADGDCVSNFPPLEGPNTSAVDIARVSLPATISNSSFEAGLAQSQLLHQATTQECFGWFVDLDDHPSYPDHKARSHLHHTVSCDNLAFQASTAPKRINDDAEVEWAKAADTVDDVLGDFF